MQSRLRISVFGTVQGVGFRPFVYQQARKRGIAGWVRNTGDGVLIEAEGDEKELHSFLDCLTSQPPPLAQVSNINAESLAVAGYDDFRILRSSPSVETRTTVPPDVSVCRDCLADILSPGNRRHGYPFTNCTHCGPRFTIIEKIPYDRPNTTMSGFEMCPDCRAEYENPLDRRFHAQPNACPVCGPHLIWNGCTAADDAESISQAAAALRRGEIVAIKGLGGFHLACDARNTQAVRSLRTRKGRNGKPFALMCADTDEIRRICEVDRAAEALLLSPEHPIVLMPALDGNGISPLVAPDIGSLGIMLPYSPLHHLLLQEGPPTLVMTSGNLAEEPICYRNEEAAERLGHIANHFLAHDRPIHAPCDDSVVRSLNGMPFVIRRARGYVPRPIEVAGDLPHILACGSDLKSAFCVAKGNMAWMSQHLGDLDNVATLDHYRRVLDHFLEFFDVRPDIVAHDMHPDYHSTRLALSLEGPRKIAVQHHHAHVASCMAENRLSGPVIGVAFDGTGYGTDGCVWGGEFLIADYEDFRRAAHLQYIPLPGGEAAIRKPGRMALAYLLHTFGPEAERLAADLLPGISPEEVSIVGTQIERGLNSPLTSSMGRLFDAVSALLGICGEVTYEGQAAIELEGRADGPVEESYDWRLIRGEAGEVEIDACPMIEAIVNDLVKGVSIGAISSVFHSTIADIVVKVCSNMRDETGLNQVALSGGVFQNMLLHEMTLKRLTDRGFEVFRHSLIPCNDGGIALGQAVVAARRREQACA